MSSSSNRPLLQRVLVLLSGFAFLGTTVFFGASTLMNSNRQAPTKTGATAGASPGSEAEREQLEAQEGGYAAVVEREPDNLTALEGLARTRIELGKLEEALEPLQKLAAVEPENQGIWQAIAAIQIQRQNYEAALEPLDRLIELAPEDEEIKQLRANIEQQLKTGNAGGSSGSAPNSPTDAPPAAQPAAPAADEPASE